MIDEAETDDSEGSGDNESDDSDYSIGGIHFDDSEEERDLGDDDDDGFIFDDGMVGKKQKKKQKMKNRKGKRVDKAAGVETGVGDGFMHNINNEDHVSDELDTGDDESGSDVEKRPNLLSLGQSKCMQIFNLRWEWNFLH